MTFLPSHPVGPSEAILRGLCCRPGGHSAHGCVSSGILEGSSGRSIPRPEELKSSWFSPLESLLEITFNCLLPQKRELKLRKVKLLAQDHMPSTWSPPTPPTAALIFLQAAYYPNHRFIVSSSRSESVSCQSTGGGCHLRF